MGEGLAHLVQGGLQEPPICVLTVGAEGGELGAVEDGLPLGGSGSGERGDERRVGHGIEVDVGGNEKVTIRGCRCRLRRSSCHEQPDNQYCQAKSMLLAGLSKFAA